MRQVKPAIRSGSAYDYQLNDKLNANSWAKTEQRGAHSATTSTALARPTGVYSEGLRQAQIRVFFFNWEEINDHGVSTPTANVPTALQKSGDFSQTFTSANALIRIYDPQTTITDPAQKSGFSRSPFPGNIVPQNRMDPIMKKIIGFYPDPTRAVSPTLQTNWSQNFALITHQDKWFTRADHNFGAKNRMFFRYGYQTSPRVSPFTNIAFPGEEPFGEAIRRFVYLRAERLTFRRTW